MELLNKLEKTVEGWLKPLPHLPVAGQKWLATNIWWLELVGVVILGLSGIALVTALLVALGISASVFWGTQVYYYNGFTAFAAASSLLFMGASVVVMAMAIKPLKAMKKKGWDLLFLALVINAASSVFSAIITFNAGSFISAILSGAIAVAIGAYFLFEIRSYFVSIKK